MAIFTLANIIVGAVSSFIGGIGAIGTCPLATNLEEFDMEDYRDRH